jgi:hypothetical protein
MKRHLAAAFIVTAGVATAGCRPAIVNPPEPIHRNPPAPQPTSVVVEPENTADPKWTDPPDPSANLPEAPAGVEVEKGTDGVCFYRGPEPEWNCPPNATCNPPPPPQIKVKCPLGK